MATHFSTLTYSYAGPIGDGPLPTPVGPPIQRSFVTDHVNFAGLATDDPYYLAGRRAKILFYPSGNPAFAQEFYSNHTVDELVDLANAGTSS